ncbi:hypothetical protein ACW2QC_13350 [Virgibacillus sp. FSP13]
MRKSKIFFIVATLVITLIGCSQIEEGTFIQGNITEINEESGEMEIEIESWTTISDTASSTESNKIKMDSDSQIIRVSNPEDYEEGQKVQVKVIKNYDEDVWDLDRLKFEVENVN